LGNQRLDHLLSKEFREEIPEGETHTDIQCVPRPFRMETSLSFDEDQEPIGVTDGFSVVARPVFMLAASLRPL
jgi:hypothetical protein